MEGLKNLADGRDVKLVTGGKQIDDATAIAIMQKPSEFLSKSGQRAMQGFDDETPATSTTK